VNIIDPHNRSSVQAALENAEAEAERRRKIIRAVLVVVSVTVVMSCLLVLGAVR
jgi:hypothetical protein